MSGQSRQLAAIMFTDIVGYTALMGRDEQKAFEILNKNRELQKPLIEQYGGKWIKELGDGVLACFTTVTDAVNAAIKIQEACHVSKDFLLRIGIHHGEVVFEENDIFGDAVNIASRIQAIAPVGGIWVSEAIHNNVANKTGITSRFVKEEKLKNVKELVKIYEIGFEKSPGNVPSPILSSSLKSIFYYVRQTKQKSAIILIPAFIVLLSAYPLFLYLNKFNKGKTGANSDKVIEKTIAVLPFTNMSGDATNEYFSDGMTDEIITQLSKIADLRVTSRTSVMLYKGTKKPLQQIAKELNVTTILEGGIQKSGETVRINAQLIDATTDSHIWADNFTRNIRDIFAMQSEVAQQIAHELHARLSKEEKLNIETKPTDNPEAYDLFLKGRYAYNNSTLEGFHNAEDLFKEAIKKDPNFKLAYSYLANVYISLTVVMGDLPPSAGASKALSVLSKSIQKDTLYIDFSTLALIEIFANKNYIKAEYYFKKAVSLNPNDELSYIVYAILLTMQGRSEEAIVLLDKAKKISPVNPYELAQRGEIYYASGKYDDAIRLFKEAIQVFPEVIVMYDDLGRVYIIKEQYQDAIIILTEGLNHSAIRLPSTLAFMAIAYFKMNNQSKASELIQELKKRVTNGEKGINIFIAIYHSAINNKEEAFKYLDLAFKTNDVDLIWLKQEPSFANLHGDPRYNVYLKRAGF